MRPIRGVVKTVYYAPLVFLLGVGFSLLLQLLSLFAVGEDRLYDRYLQLMPAPEEDERILYVAIDDPAIEAIGSWPWSRAEIARGLLVLDEFMPERLLLDIEFSDPSPLLIQRDEVSPESIARAQGTELESLLSRLFRDRDRYLAEVLDALGMVYLPLVIDDREAAAPRTVAPIPPIAAAAAGLGFSNTVIDPDGVTRRLPPLMEGGDGSHLALGLAFLGYDNGSIERSSGKVVLTGGVRGDTVVLPTDDKGHFRIRWPKGRYDESFRQLSWSAIHRYYRSVEDLRHNLGLMSEAGFLPEAYQSLPGLLDAIAEAEAQLALDDRRELIQALLGLSGRYLRGESEATISAQIEPLLTDEAVSPRVREEAASVLQDVRDSFEASRGLHQSALAARDAIEDAVEGSFVLVGYTGTSTTDLGVTPFDEAFPNVGIHGAVANMVLQGETIRYLPRWAGLLFGAFLSGVLAILLTRSSGTKALAIALGGVFLPLVVTGVLLFFWSIYLPALSALAAPLFVGILLLAGSYLAVSKEKAVVRDAFEHYLAPQVVSKLLEDPSELDVGGSEQLLTVLFSDVAGFSRISEQLEPEQLVGLLNEYLTEMSDVIMDRGGTIDKYEGDAIISFFGAPIALDNHAEQAALAALQMKKLEALLNNRFIKQGLSPAPLTTRIGINTGPMIVGNLGTVRRMNYTVMGHNVNLAARLEGINKSYGTSICVSEETKDALDEERFLLRRMDRVRAVGMDRPVRLYELVGLYEESTAPLREALTIFEKGLDQFEAREWERARDHFSTVLRIFPDDGPATLFRRRCEKFLETPPRETWDGVLSLAEK
jgi:adenylate cyclase